ncbi:class I SAM-dependent methyltransferase, partial [Clostridioides difficile]|uniref:class I SAM-dependent methyltransferase n=1 Tax=Clostridioides difficile TaxID=1496 RepID=UPI002359E253
IESIKEYPVEYMFTDISQSFLNIARSNFKQYPWVEFQLYDIIRNYWDQNINSSSYDLILCNNVLHNASDLLRVMKQIKEMVKPNGYIVILEETENNYTLLTSVEFLNGFNNVKDFRNENNQVFLDKNQWGTIIEKIGGNIVSILPKMNESLNGFGQTLFVIQIESK